MNEINLYVVPVGERFDRSKLERDLSLLDEDELMVYHRYQVEFKKTEFLLGRIVLKTQLALRLGCDPHDIHFIKNKYGKLFLPDHYYKNNNKIFFNLSHSNKVIVCAITTIGDIGVDVEHIVKDHMVVMPRVFDEIEMGYVNTQLIEEERFKAFFMLWTRKEAHIKAKGMGFSLSPLSFAVPLQFGRVLQGEWEYYTFQPLEGYMLSTAIENFSGDYIQYHVQNIEY
ncbi:MAG: 4'-phosphopantetheinyl transferase superfamily protein [Candidatus Pristimantibacillus lignocellulolyticus]|uniref:4'-phosphopantetheinyl transferase superfamily protein n=1 Tax=Candidatus Pristimantibacillus lignocellulolyticus TaxID=2994561 RepID=A0A9J6ZCY6_9BACL|nr:MAG: 4'-phosphopantetheinyl transferase superfamily protein [Candidatus Pristimantibacillus lignocellulolyticus]